MYKFKLCLTKDLLYFPTFIIIKFSDLILDWLTANKLYYDLYSKKD